MAIIAYVRHGERDSTPATIFRDGSPGTIPCSLTEKGREQAIAAGRALSAFEVSQIVASPLLRTHYTAECIQYELKQNTGKSITIVFDPLLIERQVGALNNGPVPNGLKWEEFRAIQAETGYPDIEHFDSIKSRVGRFIDDMSIAQSRVDKGLIVVATHQDTIHAAVASAIGTTELDPMFTPGVPQGSITVISYSDDKAKLVTCGAMPKDGHLLDKDVESIRKELNKELNRSVRA